METGRVTSLKEIRAVIFDLDGVIFDSLESNIAFYDHVLESVGLQPRARKIAEIVHRENIYNSLKALTDEVSQYEAALAYAKTMDASPFIEKLQLYPGVEDTLNRLSERYRLAVATNRIATTRPALRRFGLLDKFETVVTPSEAKVAKPEPRFMQKVLGDLSLQKEQVVYVGDSAVDEQLCLNSGVALVAFRGSDLQAWKHVEEMAQLAELLLN